MQSSTRTARREQPRASSSPRPTGWPRRPGAACGRRRRYTRSTPRSPPCSSPLVTEPGVVSIGGGAFVTVAPGHGTPVTVDGYVEMPGRGLPPVRVPAGRPGRPRRRYAGGTRMTIGHGSVGDPGIAARFRGGAPPDGPLPWRALVEPALEVTARGFPLGSAPPYYLSLRASSSSAGAGDLGRARRPGRHRHAGSARPWSPAPRRLPRAGRRRGLRGAVPRRRRARRRRRHGGDGGSHRPTSTRSTRSSAGRRVEVGEWTIATNPPPAIGGPVLGRDAAAARRPPGGQVVRPTISCAGSPCSGGAAAPRRRARRGRPTARAPARRCWTASRRAGRNGSACAVDRARQRVDAEGFACSVTASSGYGAGVTVPGTGVVAQQLPGRARAQPGRPAHLRPG